MKSWSDQNQSDDDQSGQIHLELLSARLNSNPSRIIKQLLRLKNKQDLSKLALFFFIILDGFEFNLALKSYD